MIFKCPRCSYQQDEPVLRCPRCGEMMQSGCDGCKLKKDGKCRPGC